jgi:ferredoxin
MNANAQLQTVFHLTSRPPVAPLQAISKLGLRPAMLARYRDLSRLRYDFPLVLIQPAAGGRLARSLSDIVNEFVRNKVPAGTPGEAMRRQLLHVEHEIRRAVSGGATGRLSDLWGVAVERVTAAGDPQLADALRNAGRALSVNGAVIDCDEAMAKKLLAHAWRVVQGEKLGQVRKDINGLIVSLTDILRAEFVRSEAGRTPQSLKESVGTEQQGLFDFNMMARMLALGSPASRLSSARRKRIEWALAVLRSQQFFPAAPAVEDADTYEYSFDSCREVQQAFRERLPRMAELVKAMSIAELEGDGRYDESRHDAFFDSFDANSLSQKDMEIFPAYFVCLRGQPAGAAADGNLLELLSSGIPAKVLVETDDLLEESSLGQGRLSCGVRSVQLASLAMGLGDTFVLQSTSSNLPALHDRLRKGLSVAGPALFSVYTPSAAHSGDLPRYLVGAAAMQSRAFPAFTYDPSAGADLASRFSLENNPQPDRDWPATRFHYADEKLQRITEDLAFTFTDFVAVDPRYARHFARVPQSAWDDHMVPIAEWLASPAGSNNSRVPYLLAVDAGDGLQRLIVDDRLVQAARRCLDEWHRLQELGGINNSHAERLLARERAAWEEQKRQEIEALSGAAAAAAAPAAEEAVPAAAAPAEVPEAVEAEPERSPDEAYIETIRCSTCNECTQINDKMFAYNDNKQAYIKDIKAGTYRQMVEAAESCQLGIIHPGKPLNPKEPGLEELLERAKPFL